MVVLKFSCSDLTAISKLLVTFVSFSLTVSQMDDFFLIVQLVSNIFEVVSATFIASGLKAINDHDFDNQPRWRGLNPTMKEPGSLHAFYLKIIVLRKGPKASLRLPMSCQSWI